MASRKLTKFFNHLLPFCFGRDKGGDTKQQKKKYKTLTTNCLKRSINITNVD